MLRGGNIPPQLVYVDKRREEAAINEYLTNADPTALNDSTGPITMFVSDNTGFVRSLSEVQRAFPRVADIQAQLSGPWLKSTVLYNILPQGAFSADQLVALQRVQTALGSRVVGWGYV